MYISMYIYMCVYIYVYRSLSSPLSLPLPPSLSLYPSRKEIHLSGVRTHPHPLESGKVRILDVGFLNLSCGRSRAQECP